MPEHTEGPWRFRRDEIGKKIGSIGKADGSEVITNVEYWIKDSNANLMAAAPDLLEVLSIFVDCYPAQIEPLKQRARHLIAKARGETDA